MVGGQGNPYSIAEKKKILKFIVDREAYASVKGRQLWQDMADEFEDRTWQSLRDHFRRQLASRVHFQEFGLTREQVELFREGSARVKPLILSLEEETFTLDNSDASNDSRSRSPINKSAPTRPEVLTEDETFVLEGSQASNDSRSRCPVRDPVVLSEDETFVLEGSQASNDSRSRSPINVDFD